MGDFDGEAVVEVGLVVEGNCCCRGLGCGGVMCF